VNISSVAPSAPLVTPQASAPNTADKTPDPTVDASADDAGAAQPTPPPPLPPGQGDAGRPVGLSHRPSPLRRKSASQTCRKMP